MGMTTWNSYICNEHNEKYPTGNIHAEAVY
jgi:hypothetical protein